MSDKLNIVIPDGFFQREERSFSRLANPVSPWDAGPFFFELGWVEGDPGGVGASDIVYLHYVLDLWFEVGEKPAENVFRLRKSYLRK